MSLIVLEGLTGVGKSTLAPRLADEIGAEFLPSIPAELATARRAIDAQQDVESRHLFYLAALATTSAQLKTRLSTGETILLESYYDRAQAFHLGMGSTVTIDLSFFAKPDIAIILECDEVVRRQRVSRRPKARFSYWHQRSEQCVARIRAYYDVLPNAHRLNSSHDIHSLTSAAASLISGRVHNARCY